MFRTNNGTAISVVLTIEQTSEAGVTSEVEDLSTAEDFKDNFSELCDVKRKHLDAEKERYPSARLSIHAQGQINGAKINVVFSDLNNYHTFLIEHNLIPRPTNQLKK